MTSTAKSDEEWDLADWAVCDEHEVTYLIGDSCPECIRQATRTKQ